MYICVCKYIYIWDILDHYCVRLLHAFECPKLENCAPFFKYAIFVSLIFSLTHFLIQKKYKYSGFCRNISYFLKEAAFFVYISKDHFYLLELLELLFFFIML